MKEVFLPLSSESVDMNERLRIMKLYSLLALWLISTVSIFAQPTFTMSDDMPMTGDTVEIDVTVEDFTDISGMQYVHSFDSLVLEYIDIIDKTSELPGLAHLGPEGATVDNGQINVLWQDPFGETVTLSSNHKIYTILFKAIGGECDSSDVSIISTDSRKIEILDADNENIGLNQNIGKVKIPGNDCEGGGGGDIIIKTNMASGDNGTEVCLQVRVDNFEEVGYMQFSMSWDQSIIEFSRVANFNLTGLSDASFNNTSGSLRCIWDEPLGGTVTLPNNSRIFDLCFNVVGSAGQMSDVDFVDSPLPIEFGNGNGQLTFQTNSGKVTVTGGGGGGDVNFILGDASGMCGDTICIPINVENFNNILAFQYSINFSAELEYVGARNFMLPGYADALIFNPMTGILQSVWDDLTGNGVTQPDGKIAELCFTSDNKGVFQVNWSNSPLIIEVTDGDGQVVPYDTTNGTITITCDSVPTFNAELESTFNVTCNGRGNGFIGITVSGGSGSYTYFWTKDGVPFDTTTVNQLFNLSGGVYTVRVVDNNDMSKMSTVTNIVINEPDPLMVQLVTTPVTNGCNGTATYIVTGGTPPYNFRWSNGQRDSVITDLCKGDYNCNITDQNNCFIITDTFTLAGPPLVVGQTETTTPTCFGDCDGSININPTGGCGDYTFSWSGPMGYSSMMQNISGLCAGMYTVTVTDTMGTMSTSTVNLMQPDSIKITLDQIQNGTTGSVFITPTGGTGPGTYTFAWTDIKNGNVLVSQSEDLLNLPPGMYRITIIDQNNCSSSRVFTISINDLKLSATTSMYSGDVNISCNGESDGTIMITVMDGIGPYTYSWSHDATATGPVQMDLPAGTYSITVMDQANGSTQVIMVTLSEPDVLTATVDEKNCADQVGDPSGSYEVIPGGGTAPYEYLWCNNSTARVPLNLVGGANCDVLVTDANGCQVFVDDFEICVADTTDPVDECFVGREVITPNGDGLNEFLIITCLTDSRFSDNELFIYNRWGQEINSYTNYVNDWTGLDMDGNEVEEDSYMWVLRVTLPDGSRDIYRGTVTLLRN